MEEPTAEKTVACTIGSALLVDVCCIQTVPSCTEVARFPLIHEYVTMHACLWSAGADQAAAAKLAYPSLANSLATGRREKACAAFFMDVSCRHVDVGSTEMDWRGPYTCDDDGVVVD